MTQNCQNSKNAMLQFVTASTISVITCSTTMPADDTIPQNTEGNEVLTISITPKSSTSKLQIQFNCWINKDANAGTIQIGLFQDSTANALAAKSFKMDPSQGRYPNILYVMTSGTTSSTTFKVRVGPGANTCYVNADTGGTRVFGGVCQATFTIIEHT